MTIMKKTIAVLTLLCCASVAHAQPQQPKEFPRAKDAYERVSWRTRTLLGTEKLTNWKFAVPASGVAAPTLWDAAIRADAAIVNFLEATPTQKVSADLAKNFDYNLTPTERKAITEKLGLEKILTYRLDALPADAETRRKIFAFAREMGVETILVPGNTDLAGLDALAALAALADEAKVNVAMVTDPASQARVAAALANRSKRLGIGIDTGLWAQENVNPASALPAIKDRLLYVRVGDRSARGAAGHNVASGKGVGNLTAFFNELNRLNIRPLALTLDTSGVINSPADIFPAVTAFENVVQPAYAANFTDYSKTKTSRFDVVHPGRGETLSPAEMDRRTAQAKAKIDAAIPLKPYATPKKPRKLLVIDSLEGMSHDTIGDTNVMIQRMGEKTGAWTTVFSNDLENLRYPKIKEFDAVFLNSIVGEFMPDPVMREGFVRYVKEGGGMGAIHGTPWASRNWDEFADMIGSQSAPHRIEHGVLKVYDRDSPIVRPFNYENLPFEEEFYRFDTEGQGRLRWDQVRVLLTVALDDPKVEPRPWTGYKRPDNIYPVAWIRNYGKGRVFYNSMGHMPATFSTPETVGHFLSGIQFILGDLDADTTPNPPSALSAGKK
jgi:type 1 glutamine amidotransferase/sugar phosphate isomerase/epimerase